MKQFNYLSIVLGLIFCYFLVNLEAKASDSIGDIPKESQDDLKNIITNAMDFDSAMEEVALHYAKGYAQKVCKEKSQGNNWGPQMLKECIRIAEKKYGDYLTSGIHWLSPVETLPPPIEGWKFHISATPQSALKIAQIILPILEKWNVGYKIAPSLIFFTKVLLGTQKGKLITIYPHLPQLEKIARDLDSALTHALKEGIISETDFEPLIGDAKLGNSGGLFARYGNLYGQKKKTVEVCSQARIFPKIGKIVKLEDPDEDEYKKIEKWIIKNFKFLKQCEDDLGQRREALKSFCVFDDRRIPWPNFMNDRTLWPGKNPFGDLPLTWKGINWDNRPSAWKTIMGSK